jgi:membrane dipeptidase
MKLIEARTENHYDTGRVEGMTGSRKPFSILAAAALLVCATCGRERLPRSVLEQVRAAQERWLTADACRVFPEGLALSEEWAGEDPGLSRRPHLWPGFRRMKEAGLDAVVLMVTVPRSSPSPDVAAKAKESAFRSLEAIRRTALDHGDEIGLALSSQDAYRFEKEGKLAVFLGLDGGSALGRDVSLVRVYRDLGVRVLALCGDSPNEICGDAAGAGGAEDPGLSDFGRTVVAECNDAGIVMDVSRCSEKSCLDVVAASEAPVIVSRCHARALDGNPRNPGDETVLRLAEKGGIVNVRLGPENPDGAKPSSRRKRPSAVDIADHIGRFRELVGYDRVGIATGMSGESDLLLGPSGAIGLTVELLRRGYDEIELEKIWGGNLMDVFDQALAVSKSRSGREGAK